MSERCDYSNDIEPRLHHVCTLEKGHVGSHITTSAIDAARAEGHINMLRWVMTSLIDYPNGGGDIGVMKEVERLLAKERAIGIGLGLRMAALSVCPLCAKGNEVCMCEKFRAWGDPPPNHQRYPHHHWDDGAGKNYIAVCDARPILALDKTAVEQADRFVQDKVDSATAEVHQFYQTGKVYTEWRAAIDECYSNKLNDMRQQLTEMQDKIDAERERCFDLSVEAVEECHRRNVSGENWCSRTVNFIRAVQEKLHD